MWLLTFYIHYFFLTLINDFIYIFSTIHPYLSQLFPHFVFFFLLLFLTLLATRHILQFTMFDLISEIKKTLPSPRRKKKCCVNYNQNKCSNIIIFGTKYEIIIPFYQITFFLAFGQAVKFL